MNRLAVSRSLLVISLTMLAGWPVLEWWQFGWPTVLVSLYHTACAIQVGYVVCVAHAAYLARKTERKIAVVGGKEVQLPALAVAG